MLNDFLSVRTAGGVSARKRPQPPWRVATVVRIATFALCVLMIEAAFSNPANAAGIGLSIVKSPNPRASQGSYFDGVSCSAPAACAAVGHEVDSDNADLALGEIWNGAGWGITPIAVPAGTVTSDLYKVSCTSATACMAVGKYDTSEGIDQPLAEAWDGARWTVELPLPDGSGASILNGISCTAPANCMAVGSDSTAVAGRALTERWDGATWTVVPAADPSGQIPVLSGVSCTSAKVCVAVGEYASSSGGSEKSLGERWNGVHWTITRTLNRADAQGNYLYGVACTSTTACIAVGNDDTSPGVAKPLAEMFDGTRWTYAPVRAPANKTYSTLVGIGCASSTSCIAVGADASPTSDGKAFAESWDGSSWVLATVARPGGSTGSYLNGAYCPAAGACTFAGGYTSRTAVARTLIESATPA